MANFDVFNGDADGLCALHQYRLTYLGDANLVTGAKRDVRLLEQLKVQASDAVTVFDIPIPQNREALVYLLNLGTRVTWFDHHSVGPLARMRGMTAIIDIAPDICTSSVVDRYLGGEHRAWAVVGAFGENLLALANRLAQPLRLSIDQLGQLRQLGQCLNYNAYGETVAELYLHPADLYQILKDYSDPFRFIRKAGVVDALSHKREQDLQLALTVSPMIARESADIYVLPEERWSLRIHGEFANHLMNARPGQAHAVLAPNMRGGYVVSERAPSPNRTGADEVCMQFPTGGGRAAAAGINTLPLAGFDEFAHRFVLAFSQDRY